ncbi:neuralized-like protein 4 [Galleria mellonella]|uniref:Neuralized-like protein 4 n=1 Tax=Galleria mellonella TaxID=7137 RepID=A0A6J1X582_GALME|nr:neuralized-like protein 4 [Galleria mellonella]XP_052752432.1 neuralized-like protein 4 [Galleria mellonella]
MRFHRRCGERVTLFNNNSTAIRNFVEFNHGLILSAEPLRDDIIFEICIDRKVNVWNGSLEIGVTTLDPEYMELPATATKLRNTAWIMSGSSIVKDGVTLVNSYGPELDTLREGDSLGVMRTNKGELMFYINGRCLGIAAKDLPSRLFAVIDLYGQCVQVSITHSNGMRPIMESSLDQIEEDPNNDDTLTSSEMETGIPTDSYSKETRDVFIPMTSEGACALIAQDRLRFHPRCGILVKLSANNKSAERARPLDDYNNGVVMTHRPLYDNELFEIRIDRLVDKWSGSIEVGVTTHNPATIRFPSTMTNMDTGTIMMSGCKVLLNGHGTCMEYGNFNLDELREGDTVGMMRKSNGKLHYFINGVDQGVATDKVEPQVWGVVDLYGMTVKVTIVDPCEDMDSNISNIPVRANTPDLPASSRFRPRIDEESLLFHSLRDSNVIIINDGKTAHRPNAFEFFNNGIVMTNRTLRTNELFQVRLDLVIPKWAGSIEIGVTQNSSNEIQIPYKMSNAKSGTWAMTGEDIIRDGTIIIPQYVRNLNRLVEGDTVGVMRKDMGILHFFVNGVDQGPAAFNIPEHVFGIIDLYGRVAQATIVNTYLPPPMLSPESPLSTESNATIYPEMCFHRVHGHNARLSRNRLTASRATVYSEFNDAVLFSSRPLRECDMFELRIDKMVDCWIGSLEIGVTAIRPDDLEANGGVGAIAGTATDLNWDTYILSGAAMMKDGECVRSGYPLDLDTLTVGSRVGMMWHADRSLHYYLDGMDMGKAWYVPHLNIYAVVDLYGQCTQVTILQNEERAFNYNGCTNSDNSLLSNSRALSSPPPPYWSFSEYSGDNICLMHDYSIARRLTPDPMAALVFSSAHLALGEIFEIKIVECKYGYAGSFRMGVTDINILNAHVNRSLPPSICYLPHYTAYIDGRYMKYSRNSSREQDVRSFVPSFEWLRPGDRIGFKKTNDSRVLVYYNSELLDMVFDKVPDKVYVVMEIFGQVTKIQAVSRGVNLANALPTTIPNDECSKAVPITICMNDTSTTIAEPSSAANAVEVSTEIIEPVAIEVISNDSSAEVNPECLVAGAETSNTVQTESNTVSTVPLVTTEPRRRRHPLPYTFHYVHGKNIKLCSSDTVAVRTTGYKDGIAIVSQPLRRGRNFRFRVDKVASEWSGSVSLGAVGSLPSEPLPHCAMHMEPPIWVVSSDLIHDNGTFKNSQMAAAFEELNEQSVLSIHFRFNSELVVDIDGTIIGVIGSVPRNHSHVFPLIDLYGRVHQISVLLHPYVVVSGASLDLPIIEESLAELEVNEDKSTRQNLTDTQTQETRSKRKVKAYSQDNLLEDEYQPIVIEAGPSSNSDPPPPDIVTHEVELKDEVIIRKNGPNRLALHHSLILSDTTALPANNNETVNRCIQKSHSTQGFSRITEDNVLNGNVKDTLRQTFSVGSGIGEEGDDVVVHEWFCDTNIRHNDRYPEANDVDNLDNEIMDALTLETGNLPDLTEEQSSSIDESTRRDDFWSEPLSAENLNYLNRILCLDQEAGDGNSLESELEASGEGCEHLHLVLKYWHFLVLPYPELRQAVSWGQVRCYCTNCQPDAQPPLAGWVRIERIDGVGAAQRAFWHVVRSTLGSAQAASESGVVRRPRSLVPTLCTSPPLADIWFDEEGKPHHTVLAIEIDVEGSDAENDRLLAFLIYLKSHVVFIDDNPPSLDE